MPTTRALGLKKGLRRERREGDVDVLAAGSMSKEVTLNPFDLCLCGSFATALGDFLMHPLDTIKIMQQSGKVKGGLFQVARQIFKDSGIAGFYPGVTAYVMGDGLSGAVKFASFEVSKKWLEERTDESQHGMVQFLCAAGAMIACSVVLVPGEVIKTRMQAGTIDNMFAGIASIVKNDGIAGLYQGYFSTLLRDVPYTMLELGLYENIKSSIQRYNQRQQQQQNGGKGAGKDVVLSRKDELIAAAITGGITGYLTTPLDVIKTKLMLASGGAAAPGFMAVLAETYKSREVFLGVVARVSWILPFTAFYLPVYDGAKRRLLEYKKQQASNQK
jgi:solute carrier family 25 S-adenosylmethionine transporter 26